MTVRPAPTRLVGFIEIDSAHEPPGRWESLIDPAGPRLTPAPAEHSEPRARCRTTRLLADITRLCDELEAEYEQARRTFRS